MHIWNLLKDMYLKINQVYKNSSGHTSHTMRLGLKVNASGSGSRNFSCMSFFANALCLWKTLIVKSWVEDEHGLCWVTKAQNQLRIEHIQWRVLTNENIKWSTTMWSAIACKSHKFGKVGHFARCCMIKKKPQPRPQNQGRVFTL